MSALDDLSGNGRHGVLQSGSSALGVPVGALPLVDTGTAGRYAWSWPSTTGSPGWAVETPQDSVFAIVPFTAIMTFKTIAAGAGGGPLMSGGYGAERTWSVWLNGTALDVIFFDWNGGWFGDPELWVYTFSTSNGVPNNGVSHWTMLRYSGGGGLVELVLDDTIYSVTVSGPDPRVVSNSVWLGRDILEGSSLNAVVIDDFSYYSTYLSNAQAQPIRNAWRDSGDYRSIAMAPGPAVYYGLDTPADAGVIGSMSTT